MDAFKKIDQTVKNEMDSFQADWVKVESRIDPRVRLNDWNESRMFETYVLGATFGLLISMDLGAIPRNDESVERVIELCRVQNNGTIKLDDERCTILVRNRLSTYKKDLTGVIGSNYPTTKQYLPHTTFNILNYSPLSIEQDLSWASEPTGATVTKFDLSSEFLLVMMKYFNRVLSGLQK